MNTLIRLIILFVASFIFTAPPYAAENAASNKYVIDHILITMRSGMGSEFQILRTLPSGTELEILQVNQETGYSLARTVKNKVEGWVLTQYLSSTPIHRDRLAKIEKKLAAVEKENAQLKSNSKKSGKQSSVLQKEWDSLQAVNDKLTMDLNRIKNITKNPVKLSAENATLKSASNEMEKEITFLRKENQVLKNSSENDGYITGASILIAGLILGFIIPMIKIRRSGYNSSLK